MLGCRGHSWFLTWSKRIGRGGCEEDAEQGGRTDFRGLSPDALIAALSDHLRNLLIALTCGKESGLLDIPGRAKPNC